MQILKSINLSAYNIINCNEQSINALYNDLCVKTRLAYDITCQQLPKYKLPQVWWTEELAKIKKQINIELSNCKQIKDVSTKVRLKFLKREFRRNSEAEYLLI